ENLIREFNLNELYQRGKKASKGKEDPIPEEGGEAEEERALENGNVESKKER
ncbi:hypothetical protein chiPu_0031744, partial [Chiloscyllium punctatum]|nr:hypothetical protein [Chiloscyllium punctatum]